MKGAALQYAVRPQVVLKYFGQLCVIVAVLTMVPLSVALWLEDVAIAIRYGWIIGILGGGGVLLGRLHAPTRVQPNEGVVVVGLTFFVVPLVMSYPMMASGLSFADAWFEAVSGATTTGLSTLSSVEQSPETFLFGRAWMQWYGGLGIMVLGLALLLESGKVAKGLAATETDADDLVGGTRAHAQRVLIIYSILTGVGILLLLMLGAQPFMAILYTMAAISTGGFSPHHDSLAGFGAWHLQAGVTLICLLGAIPLALYHQVFKGKWRGALTIYQVTPLLLCGLVVTLLLSGMWWVHDGKHWSLNLRQASLLAFSAQTTAGFSNVDVASLDDGSKLALMLAMTIGGGSGSTAGGIKILRLLIFLQVLRLIIMRSGLAPHAVMKHTIGGRRAKEPELHDALFLICLFILVIVLSWFPFLLMGYDPLDSLFEVVSATGTAGLSAGVTSSDLPSFLKAVLGVDMLMGRLELVAWLVLLYPRTWIGQRMEES